MPNTSLSSTTSSGAPAGAYAPYAGIGSRRTPPSVLALMDSLAARLAVESWTLRTGMAEGADEAFYLGAVDRGAVELFLPWPGFQSSARRRGERARVLVEPSEAAFEIAARFHLAWERLRPAVRRLHARNCHQVLGADLNTPARFVVCWTPDGSLDGRGRRVGGTGQALRIAHHHAIPVFNLARPEHARRVTEKLTAT